MTQNRLLAVLSGTPQVVLLAFALLTGTGAAVLTAQQTAADDISGMYTFLQEGEFVQITVEPADNAPPAEKEPGTQRSSAPKATGAKRVSGFVSRLGDTPDDRDQPLDHFFSDGHLDGNKLWFKTKRVHGISFEFKGTVQRDPKKHPTDEGYYVISGTLTRNTTSGKRKSSESRQIEMKLFPNLDSDEENPQAEASKR
jgi:hypothetical protein